MFAAILLASSLVTNFAPVAALGISRNRSALAHLNALVMIEIVHKSELLVCVYVESN